MLDSSHYNNNVDTINLMLYVDGLQVSKNPSRSVWPILCGIIELPIKLRDSVKNKLIAGIWYGFTKPTSDKLYDKLVNELKVLKKKGIKIKVDSNEKIFFIHTYGIICDMPAKAVVTNMIGHNGYFSCPYCFIPG